MRCHYFSCKNRLKGPRFRFLCEEHLAQVDPGDAMLCSQVRGGLTSSSGAQIVGRHHDPAWVRGGDAATYAPVHAKLQRAGTPIGPVNMLIAAQAIARKLTLVSDNRNEFGCVPRLARENW